MVELLGVEVLTLRDKLRLKKKKKKLLISSNN
jgi:hypothetical protein